MSRALESLQAETGLCTACAARREARERMYAITAASTAALLPGSMIYTGGTPCFLGGRGCFSRLSSRWSSALYR
jgi:hypothetical protein